MPTEGLVLIGCLIPMAVAGYIDWRTYRIPNYITIPVFLAGIVFAVAYGSLASALAGVAFVFVFGLILCSIGGMGGGDWKMMIALAAWFGLFDVLIVFLLASVLGGCWAFARMIQERVFKRWIKDFGRSVYLRFVLNVQGAIEIAKLPEDYRETPKNAYAFGVCLAASAWAVFGIGVI